MDLLQRLISDGLSLLHALFGGYAFSIKSVTQTGAVYFEPASGLRDPVPLDKQDKTFGGGPVDHAAFGGGEQTGQGTLRTELASSSLAAIFGM